ncbi:MAG: hypothetical protein HDP34_02865 [Clostridia bacterium]|nr:hypothetical protein [Clostridia bacterium]
MKKVFAGLVSALAVAMLCVCLSACATSFTGTWKFAEMYVNYGGVEQTVEVGKEYQGAKISEDAMILEINEDNTFAIKGSLAEMMGGEESGTWEETDGKYYLVSDGEKVEVTLSGNKLIMENNASGITIKMTFKK